MYTKSDKEFMQQLHTEHPNIYERIADIDNRSQADIRTGCHDISNIIALIYGNYQLMSLKHPEIVLDSRWDILGNDIRHLISAMNAIGEYRYAESVTLSDTDADIYLTDTINTLCAELSIPSSQITLRKCPVSCQIAIDKRKITYVLHALFLNILQIDSKAHITIKTSVLKGNFCISISDALGGLSDNIKANLFQPFNTDKSDSIGLSHAICYRILLAHNGELTYTPDDNGSTFTLILPVKL